MKQLVLLIITFFAVTDCSAFLKFTVDGINYYNNDYDCKENEVIVERLSDENIDFNGDLKIPPYVEYEGETYKVVSIGILAFENRTELSSVDLPNTITKICHWAFSGCKGIKSIRLPNSLEIIGIKAFAGCDGITSLTLPQSLKRIDLNAFGGCDGLTSVSLPSNLQELGWGAFSYCENLKNVIIEDGDNYIKIYEPDNYFPPQLDDRTDVFENCKIESIYIGRDICEACLGLGESLTNVEFGNGVKSIYSGFNTCTNLRTLKISSTVAKISSGAFLRNTDLEKIYVYRKEPPTLEQYSFSKYDTCPFAELHIPKGTKQIYAEAPYWCDFVNVIDDLEVSGLDDITADADTAEITVYNTAGQQVLRTSNIDELQSLPQGIYIKVQANKSEKIMIQ